MYQARRPSALTLASGLSVLLSCGTRELSVAAEEGQVCVDAAEAEGTEDACGQGYRCEPVADREGENVCAVPLQIRGEVLNALTGEPVEGALILALDGEGIAVSEAVTSDAQGRYEVELVAGRQPDGQLAESIAYTLQVAAQDYVPFPFGVRPATPLDLGESVLEATADTGEGMQLVLESTATSIELFPLALTEEEEDEEDEEDEEAGTNVDAGARGTIRGTLQAPAADGEILATAGALVIAEGAELPAPYGIVDRSGLFTIFNVPPGTTTLSGFRAGIEVTQLTVEVTANDTETVELSATLGEDGSVRGVLKLIDAPAAEPNVALIPSAVLHPDLGRGPVPVGMRSVALGATADAAGEFRITGVPTGRYTVVASLDDDGLVTLPVAGTHEIKVAGGEESLLESGLALTKALAVIAPDSLETDTPPRLSGKPTFTFADDPNEAGYIVRIYDGRGALTWEKANVKSVTDATLVEVPYRGKALTSGMWYQFVAIAVAEKKDEMTALSRSEDRRGVFIAE